MIRTIPKLINITLRPDDLKTRHQRPISSHLGFTLIELMVVIGIISLLSTAVFLSFRGLSLDRKVRTEAARLDSVLQSARTRANALQIPIRVVVDCAKANRNHCQYSTQTAQVNNASVTGWTAPTDIHHVDAVVNIGQKTGSLGNFDGDKTITDVYWAIFLPTRETYSSPRPFDLVFFTGNSQDSANNSYRIRISNKSGRVSFSRNANSSTRRNLPEPRGML
jgi:type II secretion system protein H